MSARSILLDGLPVGRHLVAGSYGQGIRVIDLATRRHVMIERDATLQAPYLVLVDDDILAHRQERLAGPAFPSPTELVHWIRLDFTGSVKGPGDLALRERRPPCLPDHPVDSRKAFSNAGRKKSKIDQEGAKRPVLFSDDCQRGGGGRQRGGGGPSSRR